MEIEEKETDLVAKIDLVRITLEVEVMWIDLIEVMAEEISTVVEEEEEWEILIRGKILKKADTVERVYLAILWATTVGVVDTEIILKTEEVFMMEEEEG